MVLIYNDFYKKFYLPLLLNKDTINCNITEMDLDEQIETYEKIGSGEFDYSRIKLLDTSVLYSLTEEMIFNHKEEIIKYLMDNFPGTLEYYLNSEDVNEDYIDNIGFHQFIDMIDDNLLEKILIKEFGSDTVDILKEIDEDTYRRIIKETISEIVNKKIVYEPEIFYDVIISELGMIPFSVEIQTGNKSCWFDLIVLPDNKKNLTPLLDTYQLLTIKTLPENSLYFSNPEYFINVIKEYSKNDDIVSDVIQILNKY